MNSQLNPNAAVFVPVSPTKLLMMDEAIISASPGVEYEESSGSFEYPSGIKHVDYFMRDNFSTFSNKSKEFNVTSAFSEQTSTTVIDFTNRNSQEHIPFDKLKAVLNIAQTNISGGTEKADMLETTNIVLYNKSEGVHIPRNSDALTTECDENDIVCSSEETTTSETLEVSGISITKEIFPISNQNEIDLSTCDLAADTHTSADLVSPAGASLEGSTPQKKKAKSSRYRFKKRAKKVEIITSENKEDFTTEHRRSPPIDLTFKPIQNFSDENPFGALQTTSVTTPTDQSYNLVELYKTPQETPKRVVKSYTPETNEINIVQKTPQSFILSRTLSEEAVVPFEDLDSPNELPHFIEPPNLSETYLANELSESPGIQDRFEIISPVNSEHSRSDINTGKIIGFNEIIQDIFVDDTSAEKQENCFSIEGINVNKKLSNIDLDTKKTLLKPDYKISEQQKKCEKTNKIDTDLKMGSETKQPGDCDIDGTIIYQAEENVIPAFEEIQSYPCRFDKLSFIDSEVVESKVSADCMANNNQIMQDLSDDNENSEMQETSFTNENTGMNESLLDIDFELKKEEEKLEIVKCQKDLQQTSKMGNIETQQPENNASSEVILKTVEQASATFNSISQDIKTDSKIMRLELEPHISTSQTTPEELRNLVQGFEVINKDELTEGSFSAKEFEEDGESYEDGLQMVSKKEEVINLKSSVNETHLLRVNDVITADESTYFTNETVLVEEDKISNNSSLKEIDKFSKIINVNTDISEDTTMDPPPEVYLSQFESEGTQSLSCNKLTLGSEHKTTITDNCSMGMVQNLSVTAEIVPEVTNSVKNPAVAKQSKQCLEQEVTQATMDIKSTSDMELVQNEVENIPATETLISSPGKRNTVPLLEMTEEYNLPEIIISPPATGDTGVENEMKGEEEPEVKKSTDKVVKIPSDAATKQSTKPTTNIATTKLTTSMTKQGIGAKTAASPTGKMVSMKPTASTIPTTKPTSSSVATTKPTASSLTTSNLKSTASSVALSKPASPNAIVPKPTASSSGSSKSAASTLAPSKSAASTVAPSKSASSMAPPKPGVSTTIASKTPTPGETSLKPSAANSAHPKTVASSATSSKSVVSLTPSKAGASSKSAASNVTLSKPAASSTASVKPTTSSTASVKPVTSSTASVKPAASSIASVKPTASSTASVKPAASSTASVKPTASSTASVKPAASSTASVKPAASSMTAAKPTSSSISTKKLSVSLPGKPTGAKTTVNSVKKSAVTTTSKPVTKPLSVSDTTTEVLKSPKKPLTPTSPTTPTTSKSLTVKSPLRPEMESPLSVQTPTSPKPDNDTSTDKIPEVNCDNKSPGKELEVSKNSSTVTIKPSTQTKPGTSDVKLVETKSATKSSITAANKTTVSKPAATSASKPKQPEALDKTLNLSTSAGVKKSTATTVVKTSEKIGKETVSGKLAVNGKPSVAKTSSMKNDPKGNLKTGEKSVTSKKNEDGNKEGKKSIQVQEHKVSTTNELTNHTNDQKSMVETMSQVVTETVN